MTRKNKNILRRKVNEILENYKYDGKKIHLPDKELDSLLFDYNDLDIKKIGFISNELYKLDLSNACFDGVTLDNAFFGSEIVNLKNTNAKIDLSKTPEYLKYKVIRMSNINLENVDLSNNDINDLSNNIHGGINYISNANLKNTKINLTNEAFDMTFYGCNLSYNDFSKLDLIVNPDASSCHNELLLYNDNIIFEQCNLSYTESKISIKKPIMKYQYNNLLNNPSLQGCYFQDVLLSNNNGLSSTSISVMNFQKTERLNKDVTLTLELINKQISKE